MNENLNLEIILKGCPSGIKLYSPVFGEIEFIKIDSNDIYCIKCQRWLKHQAKPDILAFTKEGYLYTGYKSIECVLFPSKEQRDWSKFKIKRLKFDPKTLKPFDKVLVRDENEAEWMCDLFSHIRPEMKYNKYCCAGSECKYCIPYNKDTKYLTGTTDDAPEYYRYWED